MSDRTGERQTTGADSRSPVRRRAATVEEAKALAHPLRVRILRLCGQHDLTNKQLADRLDHDPGTVLYHVRRLVKAGFLQQAPVRTGQSGALEKPYRSTGRSWWLDSALADTDPADSLAPIEAFQDELREAGPEAIEKFARFTLHLSAQDAETLNRRILAILDEYVETEDQRRDQPPYGGLFVLHRLAQ